MTTETATPVQQASIHIQATPDTLYALISDVTRTGEWSPECFRCTWPGSAAGPAVGARFRGWNRHRWLIWTRTCEVTAAEPGRHFAFRTVPNLLNPDSSRWRYLLEADATGTVVTESREILRGPGFMARLFGRLAGRNQDMTENITASLGRLKGLAEAQSTAPAEVTAQ